MEMMLNAFFTVFSLGMLPLLVVMLTWQGE